ncbi:MAG: thioredoxin family protein [Maritimibacter sp.]|nr:thioredoxin family protein [Maritimibacter sp.]
MKFHFAIAAMARGRSMGRRLVGALVFGIGFLVVQPAFAGELRLIMFEKEGCVWCARWHAEIGPAWPNSAEAKSAPLTHHDLHDALPEGVTLARPVAFTPVFVLLDDGVEAGRVEGYPGDNFFWFLIDELIANAGGEVAG